MTEFTVQTVTAAQTRV